MGLVVAALPNCPPTLPMPLRTAFLPACPPAQTACLPSLPLQVPKGQTVGRRKFSKRRKLQLQAAAAKRWESRRRNKLKESGALVLGLADAADAAGAAAEAGSRALLWAPRWERACVRVCLWGGLLALMHRQAHGMEVPAFPVGASVESGPALLDAGPAGSLNGKA